MPKVKSYTPAWLQDPNPGHKLFAPPVLDPRASQLGRPYASKSDSEQGPRRTIARRGTEVFVANGKELRWGDLVYLKDAWEAKNSAGIKREEDEGSDFEVYDEFTTDGCRTLKTPVADNIRQLIMSPKEDCMAVLTAYTVHICVLPDATHLTAEDTTPLKPRYFTLGPTTHVTSRSPIVSAVWHPLSVGDLSTGAALVTVTKDAIVRVWEMSHNDRWSFDSPKLTVDLRKLADGAFVEQDFKASIETTNTTFSPDVFDMEVAAACFGDRLSGGWSPMTLWIAMRGGDIYSLCPLLPEKWAPPPTLVPSLSVTIVAKVAALEGDTEADPMEKMLAQQQLAWMADLDNQEPPLVDMGAAEAPIEVYSRPTRPGAVPRLQGPFEFDVGNGCEEDEDVEICDIYAIGEKVNTRDLMAGEDGDVELDGLDREGLSVSILNMLTTSGKLRICLDLDGVEAQWLPSKMQSQASAWMADLEAPNLLTFQVLELLSQKERKDDIWSTFSPDITSRYSFFVTHPFGITHISLTPWVFRLDQELDANSEEGLGFRIGLLVKSPSTTRQRVYTHSQEGPLAACLAIRDPDLGYFLLSATAARALTCAFETPEDEFEPAMNKRRSPTYEPEEQPQEALQFYTSRPTFQQPEGLLFASELDFRKQMVATSRHQFLLNQEVRLSHSTLQIWMDYHRIIGSESARLNAAASQLFTRLESLPTELHEQIKKASLLKDRIEKISGQDADDEPVSDQERLMQRLEDAKTKQKDLLQRMERLKRSVSRATGRDLSDKEVVWVKEVEALRVGLLPPEEEENGQVTPKSAPSRVKQPWRRFEQVKSLKEDLVGQAEKLEVAADGDSREEEQPTPLSLGSLKIPSDVRKAKVAQVKILLDRETALVDAVKRRLERLTVG